MKRFAWIWLLLLVGMGRGLAAPVPAHCHAAQLSTVNGAYLYTTMGQRYQIYPGQVWRTAGWQPLDRLEICRLGGNAYSITDLAAKYHRHVRGLYRP